ncbi:hypothetical protein DL767_010175 [Monosporascus sp. MG133]|nr:hypothetical protein DL767_010175 [Monosporascus sp. MG133]
MAAEFTLFNKLPAEIRMLIWEATLPRRYIFYNAYSGRVSSIRPPAIAQVCRESRALALKNGSPHFFQSIHHVGLTWYDPSRDSVFWGFWNPPQPKPSGYKEPCPHPSLVHAMTSVMLDFWDLDREFENDQVDAKQLARSLSHGCMGWQNIRVLNLVFYDKHIPSQRHWKPKIIDAIFGIDMIRCVDLRDEKEVEFISQILYSHQGSIGDGSELVGAHADVRSVYKAREQPASQHEEPLSNLTYWDVLMRDFKYQWLIDCYEHDHETDSSAVRLYHGQPIDEANFWVKKTMARMPEIRPVFLFEKERTEVPRRGRVRMVSWNGQAWERTQ